jgi:acetate kinase
MPDFEVLFQAAIERIGQKDGIFSFQFTNQERVSSITEIPDYFTAVHMTIQTLEEKISIEDISAVGFKTVLAKGVTGCVNLSEDVLDAMKAYLPLAPVHTSVYLTAIEVFKKLLKKTTLVGLFETAFHTEIPPEAYMYGIPFAYYQNYGIRKYGFHGASHRYISQRSKELFGTDRRSWKVISCHLGGSASLCAIKDGKSVDTSMGMSPQCGLLNANRVGDLDPFALLYLMEQENLSIDQARSVLISDSGIFGIAGSSGDLRDILKRMQANDMRAELAFKTFAYGVRKYIGEYMAVLNGADCIAFTAGSGQNSPDLRKAVVEDMENIGIIIDNHKNLNNPQEGLISADTSTVRIAVIPTNEELIVAQEVQNYLTST